MALLYFVRFLTIVSGFAFWIGLFLLVLANIFPRLKRYVSIAIIIISFIFGVTAWFWGLAITYVNWGILAVIIGLFILGIGVVPMGLLICVINGAWSTFLLLLGTVVGIFVARILGFSLAGQYETETTSINSENDMWAKW